MRLPLFLLLLSLATAAHARTYYVATDGRNAARGGRSSPFRTITHAAEVASAGDTILVRGGTYYDRVVVDAHGKASAPLRIQAYRAETVVVDGSATPAQTDLVTIQDSSYVELSGFEVRYAKRIGICVWGSTHVTIRNNDVHHAVRNGIYVGHDDPGHSADNVVDGNHVHHNVLENAKHQFRRGGWASGIVFTVCERGALTNNRVHDNFGEGLGAGLSNNVLIAHNDVSDNYSANIYLDNARFITVDGNFVHNLGHEENYRFQEPAIGIGVANETWPASNPSANLTITNNIVVNTRWGFYYGAYDRGGGLQKTVVANNTFYKSGTALVAIEAGPHHDNVVENNIFVQPLGTSAAMVSLNGGGVTFRGNLWWGGDPGPGAGTGDVTADPKLAHPGGNSMADYKPTAAIDRGAAAR